jgi:dihydrolipoamide dehydrogenase
MPEIRCTLLVIGGGPGGYVAAIRAGQRGVDTVIVEAGRLGGTCLQVGFIPSKALIHAAEMFEQTRHFAADNPLGIDTAEPSIDLARMVAWKNRIVTRLNNGVAGLLKRAEVKIVSGWARVRDGKTVEVETATGPQVIRAEHVLIATGSVPTALPDLPFGDRVMSSTEALALEAVPEKLVVVGAGYIGLELGIAYRKLGAEVTVVEAAERLLPTYDAELTRPVAARLEALGIEVLTGAKARRLSASGDALQVETASGETRQLEATKVLVAVGRKPRTAGWGLDEIDLTMRGPFIDTDQQCRTSMRGVFAIGDVTGEPMLAHRAMAEGEMVASLIAGDRRRFDHRAIPAVCFTDPELVTVGLDPEAAKARGYEVEIGQFPFHANGRAMTTAREDGFVRVVARADNHLVLGIQAVGAGIAELAAGFGLALEMGATLEDLAGTIHAHPTRSEAFHEAALKALGHGLHL